MQILRGSDKTKKQTKAEREAEKEQHLLTHDTTLVGKIVFIPPQLVGYHLTRREVGMFVVVNVS